MFGPWQFSGLSRCCPESGQGEERTDVFSFSPCRKFKPQMKRWGLHSPPAPRSPTTRKPKARLLSPHSLTALGPAHKTASPRQPSLYCVNYEPFHILVISVASWDSTAKPGFAHQVHPISLATTAITGRYITVCFANWGSERYRARKQEHLNLCSFSTSV